MRAGLYIRVSTEGQETLNQRLALEEYCKRNSIEVFQVYEDAGVSGSKTSRPGLDRMMQDMRAGSFDTIIIWKLDRLGRSLQHLLQILAELQNRKVKLVITEMNMDTTTPAGELFFQIAGSFAQFERQLIRERINLGLARAKSQGHRLGRPSGSRDRGKRRRSGYWLRWSKQSSPHKMQSQPTTEIQQKTIR